SLKTATERMPSSRQARRMRTAISPRLAMSIFLNMLDAGEILACDRGAPGKGKACVSNCLRCKKYGVVSARTRIKMKNRLTAVLVVVALGACAEAGRSVLHPYSAMAQDGTIAPAENLVVEGVPAIPAALVETAGR